MQKNLTADILFKLGEVFKKNSWDIEKNHDNSIYNRFVSVLAELSNEEQKLILELTERFMIIDWTLYPKHFKNLIQIIEKDHSINIAQVSNIYIVPLTNPKQVSNSKSSNIVSYMLKSNKFFKHSSILSNINICYQNDLELCLNINNEASIILIVDDFIGTGNTGYAAINYLINEKGIDKSKIFVLSIVVMTHGFQKISSLGVKVFYSLLMNKEISENKAYDQSQINEKLQLMRQISNKIKAPKNYKLGYQDSEALIQMIRTPNNTFPFFWKDKGGRKAPFPR